MPDDIGGRRVVAWPYVESLAPLDRAGHGGLGPVRRMRTGVTSAYRANFGVKNGLDATDSHVMNLTALDSPLPGLIIVGLCGTLGIFLYLLPSIIASARNLPHLTACSC